MRFHLVLVVIGILLNVSLTEGKINGGAVQVGNGPSVGQKSFHVVAAANKKSVKLGGDATIATSSFNLAKSIIGAGVLSLPSGIAFFSDSPQALLPATILLSAMGLAAAYTFHLIGKTCAEHNVSTFKEAWSKSVGPKSSWIISTAITFKCFFASLVNSIIIGESFAALAKTFDLPDILQARTNVILAMTTLVLLPLCSMKSLNALAPFSLLGLGGVLYTALAMTIRYLDGSYAAKGIFFEGLAKSARPSFNMKNLGVINVRAFVLLSMLSTSFIAHYNAPKFYAELKDTSIPRFNKVVMNAFGFSVLIYAFMMATGFLSFGGSAAGFVLNNYASKDKLISLARFAIGVAIVTGYPFTFSALREGVLDLSNVVDPVKRSNALRPLTIALLMVITAGALVLKDLGFVVSFSGAIFGSMVMFIVPAIMNINNIQRRQKLLASKDKGKKVSKANKNEQTELLINYAIVGMGATMGALGATITTLKQLKKL